MSDAKQELFGDPAEKLVLQIMEANANALNYTTNQLLDSYKHQAETAEATLDAIRDGVARLFSGPYMPTPDAVLSALWPSDEAVNYFRREVATDE